jgi:hypothetical protein
LFAILATSGLALNREKYVFAVSELDFLGHRISATGTTPRSFYLAIISLYNVCV